MAFVVAGESVNPAIAFDGNIKVTPEMSKAIESCLLDKALAEIPKRSEDGNLLMNDKQFIEMSDEVVGHSAGIYGMNDVRLSVWGDNPLQVSLFAENNLRLVDPINRFFSRKECQDTALEFLKNKFPWSFELKYLPDAIVKLDNENAIFDFNWQYYDNEGLPSFRSEAQVRAIDRKIVGFATSKLSWAWPHKISGNEAKAKALKMFGSASRFDQARITEVAIDVGAGEYYSISG